jgi:hypothetical protein
MRTNSSCSRVGRGVFAQAWILLWILARSSPESSAMSSVFASTSSVREEPHNKVIYAKSEHLAKGVPKLQVADYPRFSHTVNRVRHYISSSGVTYAGLRC